MCRCFSSTSPDRGKPWDGLDLPEIIKAVHFDQERPKVPESMPVDLSELMCRAWSQDAAARPDFKDIWMVQFWTMTVVSHIGALILVHKLTNVSIHKLTNVSEKI